MAKLSELWKKGNSAPKSSDLVQAGLAVDIVNKKVYSKGADNSIFEVTGSGAVDFLSLTDTPSVFGNAGQVLKVNSARDGLEWGADLSGGGGGVNLKAGNGLAFEVDAETLRVELGDGLTFSGKDVTIDNTIARLTGSASFAGNVSATKFFGDGSSLSNVATDAELSAVDSKVSSNTTAISNASNALSSHVSDTGNVHDMNASELPYTKSGSIITADNVQGALTNLESAIGSLNGGLSYVGILGINSASSPALPSVGLKGQFFILETPSGNFTWQGFTGLNSGDYLVSDGAKWEHSPTSTQESDPVFTASPAGSITNSDKSTWGTSYNRSVVSASLSGTTLNIGRQSAGNLSVDLSGFATTSALSAVSGKTNSNENAINTNATAISTNQGAISSLANRVTDVENKATLNASAISTNASDISDNADGISNLDTQVTNLTGRIFVNEGAISTHSANIASNAANISANATEISKSKTAISANYNLIENNTTAINGNTSAIAANKSRIDGNESDITALQNAAADYVKDNASATFSENVTVQKHLESTGSFAVPSVSSYPSGQRAGAIVFHQTNGFMGYDGSKWVALVTAASSGSSFDDASDQIITGNWTFTQPVKFAQGTESNPAMQFGDNSAGIYAPSSGTVGIVTNGSNAVNIGSDGSVMAKGNVGTTGGIAPMTLSAQPTELDILKQEVQMLRAELDQLKAQ